MSNTATKPNGTKKPRRKNPLIDGPGPCAICHTFRGGRTLTYSKFFRGGPVPEWAIVHRGCDRRENVNAFRQRLQRWKAERTERAVAGRGVASGEREAVETINETSGDID